MVVTLNARSVARLKPKPAAYYVSDTVIRGLQIRVTERGDKILERPLSTPRAPMAVQPRQRESGVARRGAQSGESGVDAHAVGAAGESRAAETRRTPGRHDRDAGHPLSRQAREAPETKLEERQTHPGHDRPAGLEHRPATSITRRDVRELVESVNGRCTEPRPRLAAHAVRLRSGARHHRIESGGRYQAADEGTFP